MSTPQITPGTLIDYRLSLRGIPLRWTTKIRRWDPPHRFVDIELSGPFALWHHTHRFQEHDGGTTILDTVRYRLPFGFVGRAVEAIQVRADVERIFRYRRQAIDRLFPPGPHRR